MTFPLDQAETVELNASMVHSWDYGIYNVLLDGEQIAQWNLYAPEVLLTTHSLGFRRLAAGTHTLRFQGDGRDPKSTGYFLGFDALKARIPVYSRGPDQDLRDLQKPPAQ